jgi:hypothetical protein
MSGKSRATIACSYPPLEGPWRGRVGTCVSCLKIESRSGYHQSSRRSAGRFVQVMARPAETRLLQRRAAFVRPQRVQNACTAGRCLRAGA